MSHLRSISLLSTDQLLFVASVALAAVVAAALGLALHRITRRRPAPVRYGLLLSTLAIAALSPVLTLISHRAELGWVRVSAADPTPISDMPPAIATPAADTTAAATAAAVVVAATPAASTPWLRIIGTASFAAWAIGAAAGLLRIAWGVVRLRRFMLTLRPCDDPAAVGILRRSADLLGLRQSPSMFASDTLPVPMVIGLVRPVIVLPSSLPDALSAEKLEAVLLHEAAHIAHGDLAVGLFQKLAGAALWWCPPVHLLNRRISQLREDICDNYVLNVQGDGLTLAEVLVDLAEQSQSRRWTPIVCAMGALDERPGLEGRIARLLQQRRNTMTRMNRFALVGTLACGLLTGGTVLVSTLRAADASTQVDGADRRRQASDLLSAADFWDTTGSRSTHDFATDMVEQLKRISGDANAPASLRLRAFKLVCDINGKSRTSGKIDAADIQRATAAAMKYLEANLGDATVAKFGPELGITHISVTPHSANPDIWVLVEDVNVERRGGLNIQVGRDDFKVKHVKHWGKVIERPAAGAAAIAPDPRGDREAIARFIADAMKNVQPADRGAVFRRLHIDLRGTPPSAADMKSFLADDAPGALDRWIDLLLIDTSPAADDPHAKPVVSARRTLVDEPDTTRFTAFVTIKQTEGDKTITTVQTTARGDAGQPEVVQLGRKLRQTIEMTIGTVEGAKPRQYTATFKVSEGDKVLAAPKLLTLEAQLAAIRIGQEQAGGEFVGLEIELRIVAGDKAAADGAAPKNVGTGAPAKEVDAAIRAHAAALIHQLEAELREAQARIGEKHPRVVALQKRLDAMRQDMKAAEGAGHAAPTTQPENRQPAVGVRAAELELHRARVRASMLNADEATAAKLRRELAEVDVQQAAIRVEAAKARFQNGAGSHYDLRKAELDLHRARLQAQSHDADEKMLQRIKAEMAEVEIMAAELEVRRARELHELGVGGGTAAPH